MAVEKRAEYRQMFSSPVADRNAECQIAFPQWNENTRRIHGPVRGNQPTVGWMDR
jgi:hypothetical protein